MVDLYSTASEVVGKIEQIHTKFQNGEMGARLVFQTLTGTLNTVPSHAFSGMNDQGSAGYVVHPVDRAVRTAFSVLDSFPDLVPRAGDGYLTSPQSHITAFFIEVARMMRSGVLSIDNSEGSLTRLVAKYRDRTVLYSHVGKAGVLVYMGQNGKAEILDLPSVT